MDAQTPDPEGVVTVYVDAKILGAHDRALPKSCFVGYYVNGSGEHAESRVAADESDDAEIKAILFAIGRLGQRSGRLRIMCDHQSVVSEAYKAKADRDSVKNPLLVQLGDELNANLSIELKPFEYNLAHGSLTEYVNRLEEKAQGRPDPDGMNLQKG